MMRIGVLANCRKPDAGAVLERLSKKAEELGISLFASGDTAKLLPSAEAVVESDLASGIDVLVALGGDGSMLRAVRVLSGSDTPVLGVNLGSLGFMTSVPQDQLEHALDVLAEGDYKVSDRTTAECRVLKDGKELGHYRALNDIVAGWGASSRVVTLALDLDGDEVTSYLCDGLIISTPTGSTGHSLSAGGPILHPETPAFVVSVVCPHALSHRPLVIPDRCAITVRILDSPKRLLLSVDGQEELSIEEGSSLEVWRSPRSVRFIHVPGYSYFSVLRQKLGWRGTSL